MHTYDQADLRLGRGLIFLLSRPLRFGLRGIRPLLPAAVDNVLQRQKK